MTDALNEARDTSGDAPVEEARTASGQRIFTGQLFRVRDRHGWGFPEEAYAPSPAPVRRPARVSQLLDLLMLAPDLQERILDLEAVDGVEPLSERSLRAVVKIEG